MLVISLVIAGLFLIVLLGSISLALLQQKLNFQKVASAQAFHVAEAGANYYRWVLYHDNDEYCNGEACAGSPDYGPYGPYTYTDESGSITGYYELYITPPPIDGSTIVNIKSIGSIAIPGKLDDERRDCINAIFVLGSLVSDLSSLFNCG